MTYTNAGIRFKYVPNKWYNACARRPLMTCNGRAETSGGRKTYDFATWCRHEKPCENPLPAFKSETGGTGLVGTLEAAHEMQVSKMESGLTRSDDFSPQLARPNR
ncbi:Hypothetical predicted protein [Pelobates cultripes]|uniref:Uncharacterized protein n=1 Tax=Pelobates cultripes TaxID=61616 RepID=A0AAD1SG15_PELCU|nr:Hypothetical predicted protein [Pelobates cultripes]